MVALLIIPVALGIGLIMSIFDDDDDTARAPDELETPDPDLELLQENPLNVDAFEGSDAAEQMVGNNNGTEILGFGGNDLIEANGGDDAIDAGAGDDTVFAGDGNDFAVGGAGDDRVFLGDGNDQYVAAAADAEYMEGDDFVRGGAGNDMIRDYHGSNVLRGDTGNDFLFGGDDDPFAERGTNADLGKADTLHGGYGNDTLNGDDGDVFTGGEGVDSFGVGVSQDRTEDEVIITDFDPATEQLILYVLNPVDPNAPDFEIELQAADDGVDVFLDDRLVATLSNLGAADIDAINVSVQA